MKKRAKKSKKQPLIKRLLKNLLIHPASLFVLLCTGIFLVALSIQVWAVNVGVSGRIPAPLITQPAVIQILAPVSLPSQPLENKVAATTANTQSRPLQVSTQQITLSGDCPKASHIVFYRNDILAGVAQCVGDPTFSITLDLQQGFNVIKAQVFNITEDGGPVSLPIYIAYTPPTTPVAKTSQSKTPTAVAPLVLSADYKALGFLVNNAASWQLDLSGGQAPYKLTVDWGDGSQSVYTDPAAGSYTISHTYNKTSGGVGFGVNIAAQDAGGRTTLLQLVTVIAKPGSLTAQRVYEANQTLNPDLIQKIQGKLWLVWPAYIVLILMAFSFWLGEREEYRLLSRHRFKRA